MFKRVAPLIIAVVIGASVLLLRQPSAEAQQPCIPITPFSTTCAPVTTIRLLCPNQMPFASLTAFSPFVSYYGGLGVPVFNGLYYGWSVPTLVVIDSTGTITHAVQLPDSKLCQLPAPASTPTSVAVVQVVDRQVQATVLQVEPIKAGIQAPRTGDGGLLTE